MCMNKATTWSAERPSSAQCQTEAEAGSAAKQLTYVMRCTVYWGPPIRPATRLQMDCSKLLTQQEKVWMAAHDGFVKHVTQQEAELVAEGVPEDMCAYAAYTKDSKHYTCKDIHEPGYYAHTPIFLLSVQGRD
eukprot:1157194-Pelagomonas_calceolata.AAC.6